MLLNTVLALLGLSAGMVLHFRWHPLRRAFSESWDLLQLRQAWVLLPAFCLLFWPQRSRSVAEWEIWQELWPDLLREGCAAATQLFHEVAPPWPLALALPLLLVLLTVRVWRWPYRYAARAATTQQKIGLIGLSSSAMLWLGIEISSWQVIHPEWVETGKLAARSIFSALSTAGIQVWLAGLVVIWQAPRAPQADTDAVNALETTFARWPDVLQLGAFNLLWMSWRDWSSQVTGFTAWLLPEFWLLFATLPTAVALSSGRTPFWLIGATALRALRHAFPALLGSLISAVAVMMLVSYATGMILSVSETYGWLGWGARGLSALVLAMLRVWLCLTFILVMLRHGFLSISPALPAR